MPQRIDVPGMGIVEFPDDMTDQEIESAIQRNQSDQPEFGQALQTNLESVPRQVGLTGRAVAETPFDLLGILSDPIAASYNAIAPESWPKMGSMSWLGKQTADNLNLPSPETRNERIANTGAKVMLATGLQAGAASRGAQALKGVGQQVSKALAQNPASQVTGGLGGGMAGEYTKETGGGPLAQFFAALAGGFTGAGVGSLAQKGVPALDKMVASLKGQRVTRVDLTQHLNRELEKAGITIGDIPGVARRELLDEMEDALKMGRSINPQILRRIADYKRVGATPSKGSLTLDPSQVTREKNIAKFGVNSRDPKLQAMANRERENEQQLVRNLNQMGGQADDAVAAGERLQERLRAVDVPRKAEVDQAYNAVRNAAGRYADLDVPAFSKLANDAIDEQQLGRVLPSEARNVLNQISNGKIPLNVNTLAQYDRELSDMARSAAASGRKSAAKAVGLVRQALRETPIAESEGVEARDLYNTARTLARQRFQAIENNPAMKAALDGEAPDKFVQTYILGGSKKSTAASVRALADDLMDDPEAYDAARSQIVAHLKKKALPSGIEEAANFSPSGYNRVLNAIGDKKLAAFFTQQEIDDLHAIGRVAQFDKFQPTGSAVNNSNTASAFAGLLERVAGNRMLSRIPLGEQVQQPAQNWSMQIEAKDAMNPMGVMLNELSTRRQPFPAASLALPSILATEDQ